MSYRPEMPRGIPTGRVIEKLDEYLSRNDYASAERHLDYWLSEAESEGDERGRLIVLNERIGLFRKTGNREKGLEAVREGVALTAHDGLCDEVTAGTTYVNAATALKAFEQTDEAIRLYEKARAIYEAELEAGDDRLAALYNNMAITLTELDRFDEALGLYKKALAIMEKKDGGEPEMAITYLNMADLEALRYGMEEAEEVITDYLDKAEELLDSDKNIHDGNYAFVCEKCAPSFGYYGYFLTEKKLLKRAKEIYERN